MSDDFINESSVGDDAARVTDEGEQFIANGREWSTLGDPSKHMTVKHHFIGGIYTKEMHLPPGHRFEKHRHSFDHMSVLASGSAIVDVDGVETTYSAPAVITIKAKQCHSIMPQTPCVWLCQHVTACADPESIDEELARG